MCETEIEMIDGGPDGPDELSKTLSGRNVLNGLFAELLPSSKKHWWIYLGTIKPSRIDTAEARRVLAELGALETA
jgi:uncharacterized protein YdeI (YjbR/CyaY-like superfamily)